jgi:hypothetical protein
MKRLIIGMSGKANQVFKLFHLYCQQKGNVRIKELGRQDDN